MANDGIISKRTVALMAKKSSKKKSSKKKTAKVIDAHSHVNWYGFSAAKIIENMDEQGIDKIWLLSWECPEDEIHMDAFQGVFHPGRSGMPFHDIVDAVEKYPGRFIPFYAPDMRQPRAIQRLEGAIKHYGVRGFGELKIRIMLDDPRALEVFHFCGENGLPVIFHMDVTLPRGQLNKDPGYWYCCDYDNLAKTLELCPETNFIGHAPGFWREISGDADQTPDPYPTGKIKPFGKLWMLLDKHPNLYCDLSAGSGFRAIHRDKVKGREFLLKYQDRCLFARDCFDDRLHSYLKSLKLGRAAMKKIMAGNAMKLVPETT